MLIAALIVAGCAFIFGFYIGWGMRGEVDAQSLADGVQRGEVSFNKKG